MNFKTEWKPFTILLGLFLFFYFVPFDNERVNSSIIEGFHLVSWYVQEHVILCLIPAFFIAGAIAVFISQASVMKYLGAKSNKVLSYGVASVSGSILAVCSCTVLPLFAGIYRMGAGLGPATTFLYAGPAINIMAIVLTARVLGLEIGIARAVGAILFSIFIGLAMHFIFIKEEKEKIKSQMALPVEEVTRPLWKNAIYFGLMVAMLVFATWGKPDDTNSVWNFIFLYKWIITGLLGLAFTTILAFWFNLPKGPLAIVVLITLGLSYFFSDMPLIAFSASFVGLSIIISGRKDESGEWFEETWGFTKQIMPLLFGGVLIAGMLLGRPGHEGLVPSEWIADNVGGNSVSSNLFASVIGAFMYFATLTEIPILQGLIGNGMGKGPALALLLAGPALSLPNMFVIKSIMGLKKTIVFIVLVIVTATVTGLIYGNLM